MSLTGFPADGEDIIVTLGSGWQGGGSYGYTAAQKVTLKQVAGATSTNKIYTVTGSVTASDTNNIKIRLHGDDGGDGWNYALFWVWIQAYGYATGVIEKKQATTTKDYNMNDLINAGATGYTYPVGNQGFVPSFSTPASLFTLSSVMSSLELVVGELIPKTVYPFA